MQSYRHAYHAGNFADVVKHNVLVQVLRALTIKDKPLFALDTHAGSGSYYLDTVEATKTSEFEQGIGRLWQARARGESLSPELVDYLDRVAAINHGAKLYRYPGSPRLIRSLLRSGDRLVLHELNDSDYQRLAGQFAEDSQVTVQQSDGYQSFRAHLPPVQRRGLVFIDPAYENSREFEQLTSAVATILKRWATAVIVIWYPLLARLPANRYKHALSLLDTPVLNSEFRLYPDDSPLGMNGCGVTVINPPWQLDQTLDRVLPELVKWLSPEGQGRVNLQWLVAER